MNLPKAIATVFGIGFLPKGGGTAASAVYCLVWIIFPHRFFSLEILLTLFVVTIGVWSASKVETVWGIDSSKVVIDEVAGMMIALLFVPVKIKYVITTLALFRFFDILKPLGIKKMEEFPSGWGVMADDILSGIYALVIIQTVITLKLF